MCCFWFASSSWGCSIEQYSLSFQNTVEGQEENKDSSVDGVSQTLVNFLVVKGIRLHEFYLELDAIEGSLTDVLTELNLQSFAVEFLWRFLRLMLQFGRYQISRILQSSNIVGNYRRLHSFPPPNNSKSEVLPFVQSSSLYYHRPIIIMAFCFPTKCLKFFIGIGSLLTILLAIGMLAATIYANIQKDKIIDKGDISIANGALVGLYVASILFLVMGFAGLYGSIKKNKLMLAVFAIGTFLFVLFFIAGTFLFFLAPKTIFDGTCKQSKTSWITDLGSMNTVASNSFCQQACPCNLTDWGNVYSDLELESMPNRSGSDVKVQQCQSFIDQNFSQANVLLMSTLEVELECGGWCDDQFSKIFYYYSNISSGVRPKDSCYNAFKGFFEKNGMLLGLGCAVALAFSILNMMMICCLCFHPSRSGSRSDFYKRMVEDD